MTPSQIYSALLTQHVRAATRPHGFTRQGASFALHRGDDWGVITFLNGPKSTAENVVFTIGLGVALGGLRRISHPDALNRRPWGSEFHWKQRVGFLLPGGVDIWWNIDANTSLEALGGEISNLITATVIPALVAHMDGQP
jgi:hypothetical protein